MKPIQAYKFCPRCAAPLEIKGEFQLTCSSCKNHLFINSAATTAIIVENNKGEILLTKRARDPGKGKWDLPGGFLEPNETAEECAIREMQEELEVTVQPTKIVCTVDDTYLYQQIDIPLVNIFIVAELSSDATLKPADDVSDFQFVSKEKVLDQELWSEAIRSGLKKYLN